MCLRERLNGRKVKRFAEIMARGRAKGRLSIRRMQIKLLEQGNATMGVWLGKQILGQRDQIAVENQGPTILLVCAVAPGPSSRASDSATDEDCKVLDITPVRRYLE